MSHKYKTYELIKYLDKLQNIIEEEYTGTTEWETCHEEYKLKYEEIKGRLLDLDRRKEQDKVERKRWKKLAKDAGLFKKKGE